MGMDQDRTGLIRDINRIKPMPMPDHLRSHSVRPERHPSQHQKSKSLYVEDPTNSLQQGESPEFTSPKSSIQAYSPSYRSVQVGNARFKTPAPIRSLSIIDDPLRYLKQRSNDQKESIQDYIDSSKKMLQHNVAILDKK